MKKYQFILSAETIKLLAEAGVFFDADGGVGLREGQVVFFSDQTLVGQRCGYLNGRILCSLGAYSYTRSELSERVQVGNYSSISVAVRGRPFNHPIQRFTTSSLTYDLRFALFKNCENRQLKPVRWSTVLEPFTIKNDVWIGADCMIAPGITIHNGAVIAAKSVVTKDVPPYHIVGGNPAKIIRLRFSESEIEALQAANWFEYDVMTLNLNADAPVSEFVDAFYRERDNNKLQKLAPPRKFVDILSQLNIPFEPL